MLCSLHSFLSTGLCYYSHFTDRQTDAPGAKGLLLGVIQVGDDRIESLNHRLISPLQGKMACLGSTPSKCWGRGAGGVSSPGEVRFPSTWVSRESKPGSGKGLTGDPQGLTELELLSRRGVSQSPCVPAPWHLELLILYYGKVPFGSTPGPCPQEARSNLPALSARRHSPSCPGGKMTPEEAMV